MPQYEREDELEMSDVKQKLSETGADITSVARPTNNEEIMEVRAEGEYVEVSAGPYSAQVSQSHDYSNWTDEDEAIWDTARELYNEE